MELMEVVDGRCVDGHEYASWNSWKSWKEGVCMGMNMLHGTHGSHGRKGVKGLPNFKCLVTQLATCGHTPDCTMGGFPSLPRRVCAMAASSLSALHDDRFPFLRFARRVCAVCTPISFAS
jgi:hypothetical protein